MHKNFPYAYIRRNICPLQDATVSLQSKAVQYGFGCFSGIRGYWNEEKQNLFLFRPKEHFDRIAEGAKIMGMHFEMSYEDFLALLIHLIKKNEAREDIYLRCTLYAGSTSIVPVADPKEDDLGVYMVGAADFFSPESHGLKLCISSWRRYDDDMFSVKAKMTGSYANSTLAKTEAHMNGYDDAIFLTRSGKVSEATGANIFGVKEGMLYTPHLSDNNLNGITRRSVIELARNELGITVHETTIDRSTLYVFDELFLTGTAAKLAWVQSIDQRPVGSGEAAGAMGPVTGQLSKLFEQAVHGELPAYQKWLTPVY